MVVQTANEAVGNADAWKTCSVGMCLYTVQEWMESPHAYPDAATQWHQAKYKHTDDNPPKGAPVFWTGGSHGYGHIVISRGDDRIRSTDCQHSGSVGNEDLSWPRTNTGGALVYAGWTEDIGGVDIPYLRNSGGDSGGGSQPQPDQEEGLFGMTERIYERRTKDTKHGKTDDYKDMAIDDEGNLSAIIGATKQFTVTANVQVADLKDGESFDVIWRFCTVKDGTPVQYTTERPGQRIRGSGQGYETALVTCNSKIDDKEDGRSPRLRLSYKTNSSTANVISVCIDGWKS